MARKIEDKYIWTSHAQAKMRHYNISESLVKRTIRHPDRVEEAIVEDLIAAMKKTGSKTYPELWVMYVPVKSDGGKIKIITAWRFPAESKERDPIPPEILEEVRSVIGW
jgi:hypothetical protein